MKFLEKRFGPGNRSLNVDASRKTFIRQRV